MNIVLFDTAERNLLSPFTLTKPVADLRIGIFTPRERWQQYFGQPVYSLTEKYLSEKYPTVATGDILYINAAWVVSSLISGIKNLSPGESIWSAGKLIAGRLVDVQIDHYDHLNQNIFTRANDIGGTECFISYPWDMISMNASTINKDFESIGSKRKSAVISDTNVIINAGNIFLEEGAIVEHSILNAGEGPVYIGKNARVLEGCMIRGPFALGEGAILKMGTRIYGATTLGPYCLCGGEVKNSIMMASSNKAHDGYLGDSVIGEYCNLGAGTSTSNVKNTGGDIKVWISALKQYGNAGKKCGLFMGDHSRAAINTSFNSGTITEVCCNVFGSGLTPKHIQSFSWGMSEGTFYNYEKAMTDCNNWMQFKGDHITDADKKILKHIFDNR